MNAVKRKLVLMVVEFLLARLSADNLQRWMCASIEFGRRQIVESDNKVDDYFIPVLDAADEAFCKNQPEI
jgi:hypothetical protein